MRTPLLLSVAVLLTSGSTLATADKALSLERVFSDPPLEGRAPQGLALSPGGHIVTFLKPNAGDSDVLDLWGARLPDGAPALLVATADLLGGRAQKLSEAERMALERKRITKQGITSYLWCGDDARRLVFPLSGDLYLAELQPAGPPTVKRLTKDEEAPEMDPQCSSDGARIAFVKGGEVVVLDVATGAARQLTRGASETHTFGLAEFVAQEEMDRDQGMWWSPDGTQLLVFEVDESKVGKKLRARIFADRTEMFEQRYPAAGEANAAVAAWLLDVKTGKKVKLLTPAADGYLPRAGFFSDGKAWVQWQSRDQKKLALFESNAQGVLRPILEETADTWVELHDDLHPLADPTRFLWSTERSGRRQLVVVDRNSGAMAPLTNEPEPVQRLLAVHHDDKTGTGAVYFSAYRNRGRELHVFMIPLAGGAASRLTAQPGWHDATFDDSGVVFVDKRSDFLRPWQTVIRDAAGKPVLTVDDNPAAELLAVAHAPPRWLDARAEDGTVLNSVLVPPLHVDSGKKYPVITLVYGGPGASLARRAWWKVDPVLLSWLGRGWGVFIVDTRGAPGRDRAVSHAHHHRFGDVELKDLYASVAQLKDQIPEVDATRIGLWGWSYGGFLAARSALDDTSPFAAAVAIAPVADWTLYDTHYTERYLGLPVVDGVPSTLYANANLVQRAAQLARPLLLMHGTADDNVLFEHTLRLSEALVQEGKLFQMMIYPGKAHGISGKPSQLHVYRTATAFFDSALAR